MENERVNNIEGSVLNEQISEELCLKYDVQNFEGNFH